MKQLFVAAFAIFLMACNNKNAHEQAAGSKANIPANMHGFTPVYSASFVMDSSANTETVLAVWKVWKDGDLSGARMHFADSVSLFLADGSSMSGPTDTIMKNMQAYRSSFKSIDVAVDAIFAVKSTDQNENWVTVWGTEIQTDLKGKVDTISVQETWRFNKAGKTDFMMQAMRKGMLPPAPAN